MSEEKTFEQILTQPKMVKGLVTTAYRSIPNSYESTNSNFLDCATDNAVTNQISSNINKMIELSTYWGSTNNPIDTWNSRYEDIRSINTFLKIMNEYDITFKKSTEEDDSTYKATSMGEAYFLRAMAQFELLKRFGGKDENGSMVGFPIVTDVLDPTDFPQLERNSYDVCVNQIISDLDMAKGYLPLEWTPGSYIYTNEDNIGRPTDIACQALKARVLLYAASPAFNEGNDTQKWTRAAQAAKEAIDMIGFGLPDIYATAKVSKDFYNDPQNDEIIMRRITGGTAGDLGVESRNFLPSIYGGGRCNPTQNLVDAFPMANGYPIAEASSGYDEADMYTGRDPRFYNTILYNGASFKGTTVETFAGGKDLPGVGQATIENSTRTGYYLRKWLSNTVSLVTGNTQKDWHYMAVFRQVELYLNFAEAASKAGSATTEIDGLSAKAALAEVRRRAGIASGGTDDYLETAAGNAEMFNNLVKNERRIELCFEGHRFWDVRRWKDQLNTTIQKIEISAEGVAQRVDLLQLAYDNNKVYCPLPISELNKTENITQNQGW